MFRRSVAMTLAIFLGLFSLFASSLHPYWSVSLVCAGGTAFIATSRWPRLFFVLFPVALAAGDGYLWTGQLVVNEYDSFLLASLAGVCLGSRQFASTVTLSPWTWRMGGLFFLTVIIAAAIGFASLPHADFRDQLSCYFTSWNTVRILKGYAWGALFILAAVFAAVRPDRTVRSLFLGFQIAAVYVGGFVLAERCLFESWWDFRRELRAAGPFASMHIGDHHLDAFVILVFPLVWYGWKTALHGWGKLGSAIVIWLVLYAGVATMSRATIAILGVQFLAIVWLAARSSRMSMNGQKSAIGWGLTMVALAVLASVMVFVLANADAVWKRFESSRADLQIRRDHMSDILAMASETQRRLWFGHGMGHFPTGFAARQQLAVPPLRWIDEAGGTIVMQSGWQVFLERRFIQTDPGAIRCLANVQVVNEDVEAPASFMYGRCYKDLLQSYEGDVGHVKVLPEETAVVSTLRFESPSQSNVGSRFSRLRPQSCWFSVQQGSVALSEARFETSHDLVFGNLDRDPSWAGWAFSCDDHLIWRTKNAWVHLLYEHGIVGLLSVLGLQLVYIGSVWRTRRSLSFERMVVLGSLLGGAAVACVSTLIDTPNLCAMVIAVAGSECLVRSARFGCE